MSWSLLKHQSSLWAHFEAAIESGYEANSWITEVCGSQADSLLLEQTGSVNLKLLAQSESSYHQTSVMLVRSRRVFYHHYAMIPHPLKDYT